MITLLKRMSHRSDDSKPANISLQVVSGFTNKVSPWRQARKADDRRSIVLIVFLKNKINIFKETRLDSDNVKEKSDRSAKNRKKSEFVK